MHVAGEQQMSRIWSIPPRQLAVHDLVHVEKGQGLLTVNQTEYPLKPDRWFLLPARVRHSMQHDPNNPLYLHVIHFEAHLGPGIDVVPILFRAPALDSLSGKQIQHCMRQVIDAHTEDTPLHSMLADRWANLLLCLLAIEQKHSLSLDSRVSALLDHLHANYQRELSLSDLAAVIHASPAHMRDLFKRSVGISPMAYFQKLRIEKAQNLLRTTDLSIGEIARHTGWQDHTAFDRIFRKHAALTPLEYRAATRQVI